MNILSEIIVEYALAYKGQSKSPGNIATVRGDRYIFSILLSIHSDADAVRVGFIANRSRVVVLRELFYLRCA